MLVPVGMKEKSIKAHCLPETCAHAEYLLDGGTKDLGKTNTFEGTEIYPTLLLKSQHAEIVPEYVRIRISIQLLNP
jgi:hypothetical protein